MSLEKTLPKIVIVEFIGLIAVISSMLIFSQEFSSQYRLYEVLGALFGAILATYGVYKMDQAT